MSLAERRAAALAALTQRRSPAGPCDRPNWPPETRPSTGDFPDDPSEAEAYLAARALPPVWSDS